MGALIKLVLIGAGQRGRIYADYLQERKLGKIEALVEPHEERREAARLKYGIPSKLCFTSCDELWSLGKIADGAIIASMDQDHYGQVMDALEIGYDLLLEKPVSPNPLECMKIQEKAERLNRRIVVCHVLRYTPFFSTLKQIIDSGQLGKVISIQHNENIGNFHMAHSFVRGNWRKAQLSSPLIMQKSCHDMDILTWLSGSRAQTICSYGDLRYFKEENAPENSTDRCYSCGAREHCRYDAYKAYLPAAGQWPATVVCQDQTEMHLIEELKTSPYGRCVYRCDNDVCDNQVALIRFENGVTVSFQLSAFTNKMCRTIKIMCEHGEIRGNDGENRIEITRFTSNQVDAVSQQVVYPQAADGGHGGGDVGIAEDFIKVMKGEQAESRSSIGQSVESHFMAYAAEKSRLEKVLVDMKEFRENLERNLET